MLKITNLRCEYLRNPLGVRALHPRLSWQVESNQRGFVQQSWHILAATEHELLDSGRADLWDSGLVQGAEQVVELPALPGDGERVWWKVEVRDNEGGAVWSGEAWFETEFPEKNWEADWLGFPGNWPGSALRFRKAFTVKGKVKRARLYAAGVGWNELWLNGRRVSDRVLDPPQSDYAKRIYASADIVEKLLRQGENVLGVRGGYGWYGTVRIKAHLRIEYEDGRVETVTSNANVINNWQVAQDPAILQSVYGGEVFDARLDDQFWCTPGHSTESWPRAQYMGGPGGKVESTIMQPMRVRRNMLPAALSQPKPGVWVADFGQNQAGWVRLRVRGDRGRRVVLHFAESLYEDGTVNQENLHRAEVMDTYILKGGEIEQWEPSFTYHGFRYVQIDGWPGEPGREDLVACLVCTEVEDAGSFASSNELLNRIHELVRQTELSNLPSIPADCPQRAERMGWLNDMAARSEELMYNFAPDRLLAKWMADIADAQDELGRITDTAPFHWGAHPADPVSVCYLLDPWLIYTHMGDKRLLEERFQGMRAWVDFLAGERQDGLVHYSYWGDWSPPAGRPVSPPEGDSPINSETPGALVSTACLAYSARLLSQIAGVLGRKSIAAKYMALFEEVALEFNAAFWDEAAGGYGKNNQSANAIALYMGLVPEDRLLSTAENLYQRVEEADFHLKTGNICTKYLLEALSQTGRSDLALRIALQKDYPSWGYMLANGATTLWERWEKATGRAMNSHNHPMMGSVGSWLYRWLAGIRVHPAGAGFSRFSVNPEILDGLDWVKASLETVKGRIRVEWERRKGTLHLLVEVPVGSQAEIGIPCAGWGVIREGRACIWKDEAPGRPAAGLISLERMGPRVRVRTGSGVYRFQAEL